MRDAADDRGWVRPVAFTSLVLFGILIPLGALLVGVLADLTNVIPNNPERDVRTFQALIVCGISAVLAVLGGMLSAVGAPKRGLRAVGLVGAVLGLLIGAFVGVGITGFVNAHTTTVVQHAVICGLDGVPAGSGPDAAYDPCPDDIVSAQDFLADAVTVLPTENVTPSRVADAAETYSRFKYKDTIVLDDGSISVAWVPAIATCAIATWQDGGWVLSTAGQLVSGGCPPPV